jgi:predicted TIM-barrel fold metal-dependent hydrolase
MSSATYPTPEQEKKMICFDALTSYGPYPHRPAPERWSLADLLADLDHYGIHGALVRHAQCYSHDAMAGNRRLIAELAPHRKRLFPCWVVGPHQCGEFPDPDELLRQMDANEVRVAQICPQRHGYPVDADFLGELAARFNARRIPLLVFNGDVNASYEAWKQLCALFKNCPVLMADVGWSELRMVDAAVRVNPNLHVLFSRLQSHRGVEWMAERHGIERCIFGSCLPQMSGGAARGFIDWTFLGAEDAGRFAGGNLARLMNVDLKNLPEPPPPADELIRVVRSGQAVPDRVLDAHAHVLDDGGCGVGTGYVMPGGDARGILSIYDRCGIDGVAMMSWQGPVGMDAAAGNELISRLVAEHGSRILGLTSVDPLHQNRDELERALQIHNLQRGFRGIKPYWPRNGILYSDPAYNPCWEFANRYGLYVLAHVSGDAAGTGSVVDAAQRYPRASFLIAHSGGDWGFAAHVAKACQTCPNVYAEITLTPVPNGIVEWLCEQVGADHVLFGSDVPMRDCRPQLGWVVNSRLSLADKRKVLAENFAGILARAELPGHELPPLFRPLSGGRPTR